MEMRIISYSLYTISYQIWYEFFACFFLMHIHTHTHTHTHATHAHAHAHAHAQRRGWSRGSKSDSK